MKTRTLLSGCSLIALAVSPAHAVTYSVAGQFSDINTEIFVTSGSSSNVATSAALNISGLVTTDSSTAGYQVTGGTIHLSGSWVSPSLFPSGPPEFFWTLNISGTATGNGVMFDSGSVCIGSTASNCSEHTEILSASNTIDFTGASGNWQAGYAGTSGLQLLGGAGGNQFTVAQPGYYSGPASLGDESATGVMFVGTNVRAVFLEGDLTFTQVPVPAGFWLFGSALLGLAHSAVTGRRRAG